MTENPNNNPLKTTCFSRVLRLVLSFALFSFPSFANFGPPLSELHLSPAKPTDRAASIQLYEIDFTPIDASSQSVVDYVANLSEKILISCEGLPIPTPLLIDIKIEKGQIRSFLIPKGARPCASKAIRMISFPKELERLSVNFQISPVG